MDQTHAFSSDTKNKTGEAITACQFLHANVTDIKYQVRGRQFKNMSNMCTVLIPSDDATSNTSGPLYSLFRCSDLLQQFCKHSELL